MGTQNKEIKIALDVQAKIDKASGQIEALKKQISGFDLSKGLANEFAKEFKSIENELVELQRKTASGEINLIDAKAAEKQIDQIEKRWAFLLSKIGGEGFLEKGLKLDKQALDALGSLQSLYTKGIKEAELQEGKLNKKLEEAKQHQKELLEAQKDQKVVKASELDDQRAQLVLAEKAEKAAKKTRDEAEKALRAKVEESGGKYTMDQAGQKGSPLRKTDAYKAFKQAQSGYDQAKEKTRTEKAALGSMVTKEMQVAEATAAKEAIESATAALENYRQTTLATAKEDAFEKAKNSLKEMAEFKDIDWGKFGIDLSEIKSVEDLEDALSKLRIEADKRASEALKNVKQSAEETSKGFQGLGEDVKEAKDTLVEYDEQAKQVEAFEGRIKQFLGMAGAVEVFRRALRQAFETTKELDAAMTEMAVVTDLEVGDYWDQLPEHTKRASELGVAIKSVYEAETLYYQQGLKTEQAQSLANTTLKMARIAGLDAAEATNKMTAALRGFNMELNEASAEKVADVYSELAAITAADVNEISSAMTKTASIASSAGMEFETTAAFLSQIIETTRESAETAGTAMKTVIARFQELKKAPSEIGEVDGEIVDANAIETALRSVGVALRDSSGQFRDLDEVFLELSSKWDSLDKNTQRYIATIAAGSRQQSRFIAMMSDYGRTQELVTAANNSAGASQKQYEKSLESLESKLARLKNAWDEFSMGILESDLVKFGVDALTKFLEIINKATSALDGMGGTITKVLTTVALFKLGQKIFDGIKKPMLKFFKKLVTDVYTEGQKAGQAFAQGVADSQKTEKQKAEDQKKAKVEKEKQYLDVKEPESFKDKAFKLTGISDLLEPEKAQDLPKLKKLKREQSKKDREQAYLDAKKKFDTLAEDEKSGKLISKEEINQATDELDRAEKALIEYKKTEESVAQASKKGWDQVSAGYQKLGGTIAGLGVGMSVLGSIMSELGFEEAGEGMAKLGNIITIAGAAMSALGTITPVVSKALVAAGIEVQAAWWWVALIVGAIVGLIAITAIAISQIEKASPEGKLKAAEEAAQQAAEAADEAAAAYDSLVQSLDSLGDKYKTLEDLTEGTKEWNAAIREINNSVLELISDYPELAKFVDNTKGYLELDINSDEVQAVLQEAENRKITTLNASSLANIAATSARNNVQYGNLTGVEEVAKLRSLKSAAIANTATFGNLIAAGGAAYASHETTKTDKKLQGAVDGLVDSIMSGAESADYDSIFQYLTKEAGVAADEAKILAENFSADIDSLIKYGQAMDATKAQQQAAYESIAMSAQSLANTLDMTKEQIQQSKTIVDGDLVEELYNEKLAELENWTVDKDIENNTAIQEAIAKQYGEGAKIDKTGKVTYQKDGVNAEVTLTTDQVKSIVATQYATEGATTAIEHSDEAIARVSTEVQKQLGGYGKKAVNTMYMSKEGGALTKQDLTTLQSEKIDYQAIWRKLSEEEKQVYKNDISNLVEDFEDAITKANKKFEKAGDVAESFMTADMAATWKDKLDEVASFAGGEEAKATVQKETRNLLASVKDDDKKREIQSRIDATDWTSQESLLALQIDLQQQYGYTTDEAETYVNALGDAAYATSGLNTTVKVFGDLWQATEKINQSMTRLNALQWEYDQALKNGSNSIGTIVDGMLDEYQLQAGEYAKAYEASNEDIAKIYAQGGLNYGTDLRQFVKLGANGVDVDQFALQDAIDSGKVSQEDADKWIQQLSDQYKTSQDQVDGLRKTLENIQELEEASKEAYFSLRDMAKEAILGSLQKQIDLQKENLEATKNANQQLISKIQEQIDDSRQTRENERQEEELSRLRSQQSYLGMDTSGQNSLQILENEQALAQAEEDYRDTLIDQALQNISDANEEASQQRERQITLAEDQLAAYELSADFQRKTDASLQEMLAGGTDWQNSNLGQMLVDQFATGMSQAEKDIWAEEMNGKIGLANNWLNTDWVENKNAVNGYINTINSGVSSIAGSLTSISDELKLGDQRKTLAKEGFKESFLATVTEEEQMNRLTSFAAREDAGGTTSASMEKLDKAKQSYLSKEEYYDTIDTSVAGGSSPKTYEEYLRTEAEKISEVTPRDPKTTGYLPGWKISGLTPLNTGSYNDDVTITDSNGKEYTNLSLKRDKQFTTQELQEKARSAGGALPTDGYEMNSVVIVDGVVYARDDLRHGRWGEVRSGKEGASNPTNLKRTMLHWLNPNFSDEELRPHFKTGGLADFTGPAWLDGTKSRPEYVLNSAQTERFFSLIDVLEKYDAEKGSKKSSGDNYFEIEINVDKLENDYDVEKLADKIRSMLYDDATSRNVNAVNRAR